MLGLRSILAKLISRPVYTCCLILLGLFLLTSLVLRVQAYLFARHAIQTDAIIATFRAGETTREEALARLPGLELDLGDVNCRADECRIIEFESPRFIDPLLSLVGGREWASVTLYRLGLQYYSSEVEVKFISGKVSSVQRSIRVQTSAFDAYPASVITESAIYPDDPSTFAPVDQPLLILRHASNVPELGVRIGYDRSAPQSLIEKAYSLNLKCLWLTNCHSWHQIAVDADRVWLAELGENDVRAHKQGYCPERLIGRWANEAKSIEVVEVIGASANSDTSGAREDTKVTVRQMQVAKGVLGQQIRDIYVPDQWYGPYGFTFNPVLMHLQTGGKLIVFQHAQDDGVVILDPCQAIAATPAALDALQTALETAP